MCKDRKKHQQCVFPTQDSANTTLLISWILSHDACIVWSPKRFRSLYVNEFPKQGMDSRSLPGTVLSHETFNEDFLFGLVLLSGPWVGTLGWAVTANKVIQPWSDLESKIKARGGCSESPRRIFLRRTRMDTSRHAHISKPSTHRRGKVVLHPSDTKSRGGQVRQVKPRKKWRTLWPTSLSIGVPTSTRLGHASTVELRVPSSVKAT